MRLPERDKRDVYLRRRMEATADDYGEPTQQWGSPVLIRSAVQPASSVIDMQVYGERVKRMKRLYYDGGEKLQEGDGLCIDVAGDQEPDYWVVSAMSWDELAIDAERRKEYVQPEQAAPAVPKPPGDDDPWQ